MNRNNCPSSLRLISLVAIVWLSVSITHGQEVEVIPFEDLQEEILSAASPLSVFNFWATWCRPCVNEIPHFEAYADDPEVAVYLISLDFVENVGQVREFARSNHLKSNVYLLNETNYNSFMEQISPQWSGAIPATLFVDEWGKSYFHESEFTKEELDEVIEQYRN